MDTMQQTLEKLKVGFIRTLAGFDRLGQLRLRGPARLRIACIGTGPLTHYISPPPEANQYVRTSNNQNRLIADLLRN